MIRVGTATAPCSAIMRRGFGIDETGVLDAFDAAFDRALDRGRRVEMAGDIGVRHLGLFDGHAGFRLSENPKKCTGSVGEATPPFGHQLDELAAALDLLANGGAQRLDAVADATERAELAGEPIRSAACR